MSEEEYKEEGQSINPTDGQALDSEAEGDISQGGEEDATQMQKEIERQKEVIRQLTARAKKAEAHKQRNDLQTPDAPVSENVDERILISQGIPSELLTQLKKVAKFNEVDLITAQSDPLYVAMKEKYEQELRDKQANLGASRGSGPGKPVKGFTTPGLKAEDHKALWQKASRG